MNQRPNKHEEKVFVNLNSVLLFEKLYLKIGNKCMYKYLVQEIATHGCFSVSVGAGFFDALVV